LSLIDIARRAFGLASTSASSLFLLQEPASSGEVVTEETAWRLVPVYRAITMVSNDLGRLPVTVASGTARGMEPLPSPAADLLSLDANRYMGAFEFRRTLSSQCLRYGNAFAQIVRNGRGDVLELVPLLPTTVTMHVHQGVVSYRHSEIGELAADEVLHLRAPGGDGLWGESPVRMAREALGLQRAMDKTAGALYRNAGVPKLAFVHPGPLSAAAQQSIADSTCRSTPVPRTPAGRSCSVRACGSRRSTRRLKTRCSRPRATSRARGLAPVRRAGRLPQRAQPVDVRVHHRAHPQLLGWVPCSLDGDVVG
jgi:phage portal protein BeeE